MNIFTQHPHSVGETYVEHMLAASSFGISMIVAGCACLVHGVFPFTFEKTGSSTIGNLYSRIVMNRIGAKNLNKARAYSAQNSKGAPAYECEWCI